MLLSDVASEALSESLAKGIETEITLFSFRFRPRRPRKTGPLLPGKFTWQSLGANVRFQSALQASSELADEKIWYRKTEVNFVKQHLAALRAAWAGYLPATQDFLVRMTQLHGEEFARRIASIIDAEKQQSSMLATVDDLMAMGKRLNYPELHITHPAGGNAMVIRAGLLNWQHFADVAEGRAIRAAENAARACIGSAPAL